VQSQSCSIAVHSRHPALALTIAGSDSGGGAGLQADVKTLSALGVHATCVVTALTVQDTRGVRAIHHVPPEFVERQLRCVLDDFDVRAVKTGMLGRAATIEVVARALADHPAALVVDPVRTAQGGALLLDDEALACMKSELFGRAQLLTPNWPEAAALLDADVDDLRRSPEDTARRLLELGPGAVVLKGGHAEGPLCEDIFATREVCVRLSAERIATDNTHGTGCAFSAAVVAHLALGQGLEAAVRAAKEFISAAIRSGARLEIGHGHGPVNPMHAWW
jgi:hydroxymethylpyrimidine/phosphomethylpyrimidine kinase